MSSPEPNQARETSLFEVLSHALRYYLGGRRGLLLSVFMLVILGLTLNWQWLVALGVAPLLLSLLPCAAMCALGLCMHKLVKDKNSCNSKQSPTIADDKPSHPIGKSDDAV